MHGLVDLLIELLIRPFTRDARTSRLGESRLDRETRRFWQIVSLVIAALLLAGWLWFAHS